MATLAHREVETTAAHVHVVRDVVSSVTHRVRRAGQEIGAAVRYIAESMDMASAQGGGRRPHLGNSFDRARFQGRVPGEM